jgi:hypothetical protein
MATGEELGVSYEEFGYHVRHSFLPDPMSGWQHLEMHWACSFSLFPGWLVSTPCSVRIWPATCHVRHCASPMRRRLEMNWAHSTLFQIQTLPRILGHFVQCRIDLECIVDRKAHLPLGNHTSYGGHGRIWHRRRRRRRRRRRTMMPATQQQNARAISTASSQLGVEWSGMGREGKVGSGR